jgi:Flp pilus assembly secretin CpaC
VPAGLILVILAAKPSTAQDETDPAPPAEEPAPIITKEKTVDTRAGDKKTVITETKILDVAVTRPEVADAFVTAPRELTLISNSPGIGKAVVHLEGGARTAFRIRVHVADAEKFAEELKKKIGHIQNLSIEVVKGKILVDGRVLYLKDMDAIERALGDNPSIINLTSLSSRNARILSREIERELRESGIYGASVEVRNNRVTLVGTLPSKRLVARAEKIASTYTPNFDSLLKVAP